MKYAAQEESQRQGKKGKKNAKGDDGWSNEVIRVFLKKLISFAAKRIKTTQATVPGSQR